MSESNGSEVVPDWTLGDRIRKARRHGDMGQVELAEKLGIGHTRLANWERGAQPRDLVQTCRNIADATGVSFLWLLTGEDSTSICMSPSLSILAEHHLIDPTDGLPAQLLCLHPHGADPWRTKTDLCSAQAAWRDRYGLGLDMGLQDNPGNLYRVVERQRHPVIAA